MLLDLRLSALALAVTVGAVVLVVVRVATAPAPRLDRAATAAERAEVAAEIAFAEPSWRAETAQNFPSDHWSQRDDFHGRELRKVLEIRSARGIRLEDVLRAVDDDIHQRRALDANTVDTRDARAVPCKPRPFYD